MKTMINITLAAITLAMMSFAIAPVSVVTKISKVVDAAISWKTDTIDVGDIPQGTPKVIIFEFTNTSDKSVLISTVQGSCGCTATDYSKDAIAPSKSTTIKATYNAANVGAFTKTVTVTTTADVTPKVLTLKGVVIAKTASN